MLANVEGTAVDLTEQSSFQLEMNSISKAFPGVQALSNVSLRVNPGEIHALVGENGAGKSTLVKILSGAYERDEGRVLLDGQEVEIHHPAHALEIGIVTIYQETNLSLSLDVAENIYMGRLPHRGLFVDWEELYRVAGELLNQMDLDFDPHTLVEDLSPAQRQMVEIAKALSMDARIIVLDEPTASLTDKEVDVLFDLMQRVKQKGISVVFITHRLQEVFDIADAVTVLRDGTWISTDPIDAIVDENILVNRMVGRDVEKALDRELPSSCECLLVVENLSGHGFRDVSFKVGRGEIVGMFGLVGSGRTEVVRTLFGAQPATGGRIELDGSVLAPRNPLDSITAGMALIPEDRKGQGLVLDLSIRGNIALPNLARLSRLGFMRRSSENRLAEKFRKDLDIRCPDVLTIAGSLSGGNQQKVVISKWLAGNPKLLILDEPTRGIDIAGKAEVHRLMAALADKGVGLIMVSSELPEILKMSDRVLVMHEGHLMGEIERAHATEERVMQYATGQPMQGGSL